MSELAYLRGYASNNCDFRFPLLLKTVCNEDVVKDFIAFVNASDTLSVLIDNIKEKIVECTDGNKENSNEEDVQLKQLKNDEIRITFTRNSKTCKTDLLLSQLIGNVKNQGHQIEVQILEQKFKMIVNAPMLRLLELPAVIVANFPVEPLKFRTLFTNIKKSHFYWYKSSDKLKWEKVGSAFKYDVSADDIGYYLKLCCVLHSEDMTKGPAAEVVSDHPVESIFSLPSCPFETRHKLTKTRLKGKNFRVVSYNILADRYSDLVRYPYCPPKALNIHYRKQLIIKELKGYNADIIALQEVDNQHYTTYFKAELAQLGYKTLYHRKGNCIPEGLLFAFNKNRYKLLETKHIVFKMEFERRRQFVDVLQMLESNDEIMTEFKAQNTSFQLTVLMDNKTKDVLIVGNTHLYYHPDANHIRLLQGLMATTFSNTVRNRLLREHKNVAVVFCGDFNSHPKKSLYEFIVSGTVDPAHNDCLKISPSGDARFCHKFILESATGTPKYTNYTAEFKECLDYIFIERNKIKVKKNIPVTSAEILEQYVGLPNEYFPSDHLALVVDLEIFY